MEWIEKDRLEGNGEDGEILIFEEVFCIALAFGMDCCDSRIEPLLVEVQLIYCENVVTFKNGLRRGKSNSFTSEQWKDFPHVARVFLSTLTTEINKATKN